jgi:DNA-binding NarL/FixJ family response regulator
MSRTRVLMVDDHVLLLEACAKLIEPHFEVAGLLSDGQALLSTAVELKPDVIVLDISMPVLNGLDAGRRVKKMMPGVKLIFLTMYEDPDLAAEAMRSGASAYLLKTSAASELVNSIKGAIKGRTYVTPQLARAMEDSFIRDPENKHASKQLTPRQREVLQLLAEGRPMKEAAYILKLSTRTVAFHKYRIMEQLGLKSSAELVQFAVTHRIVSCEKFSPAAMAS